MSNYCAECGRSVYYKTAIEQKDLWYHQECAPKERQLLLEKKPSVKHINENSVELEMLNLQAMINMINEPHLQLVKR